jgi:hypothetical protein
MSTSGYSEEELAGLSEEERAAIEAEVDETELTATASPVDLPDDEGEEDDAGTGDDDGDGEGGDDAGEDPGGEDGGEGSDDEGAGDDAGEGQDDGDGGDDAGDPDPVPTESDSREEPVNPYDYSDTAKEKLKDLREKLNDGDLSPAEYEEKADAIKSDDYKARLQESENRRWGNAVASFLGHNKDYTQEASPTKFAALDSEVKRMANAGEIGNMTHLQILQKAKANVEAAFGSVPKVEDTKDEGGKPKPKPKPKAKVPETPNLGDVPAAGVDNPRANASEFANLDKLTGADLESALEKMTPAQQERYLAGR